MLCVARHTSQLLAHLTLRMRRPYKVRTLSRLEVSLPAVWTGWVVARIILALLILRDWSARNDILYYVAAMTGHTGNPADLTEYPHAGIWPLHILVAITGFRPDAFYIAFVVACLLCDALFLALLLRGHRDRPQAFNGAWFWVFFGTAAGQILVMRLDLYPSLAVAGAVALLATRPAVSAALLSFATTMKLWPGVLAAGLVGRITSSRTWIRLVAFGVAGIALCAVTALTSGIDRLLSPLAYQDVRGLQIESIPATRAMLRAFIHPEAYQVGYAPSKSFEIAGPGTDTAIEISSWLMVATIVFALAWAVFHFFAGGWNAPTTMVFFLVAALLLIACNKVFSPQYIVWIGPLIAVILREYPHPRFAQPHLAQPRFAPPHFARSASPADETPAGSAATYWLIVTVAILAVIAAGLGTYVYPFNYDFLHVDLGQKAAPLFALATRNGLIVIMTILSLIALFTSAFATRPRRNARHASSASAHGHAAAPAHAMGVSRVPRPEDS